MTTPWPIVIVWVDSSPQVDFQFYDFQDSVFRKNFEQLSESELRGTWLAKLI